jgi:hypothetical protein
VPQVSGDRVGWRAGNIPRQIFTWKAGASQPTTLTGDGSDHGWPQVSGDRVIWTGGNPHPEIFTWKAGDPQQTTLTTDPNLHLSPEVSGDRIVWLTALDATHYALMTQKIGDARPTIRSVGECHVGLLRES